MCATVEKMIEETVGRTRKLVAINMIKDGKLSLEDIARYTDMPIEKVKDLATSETA